MIIDDGIQFLLAREKVDIHLFVFHLHKKRGVLYFGLRTIVKNGWIGYRLRKIHKVPLIFKKRNIGSLLVL